MYAGIFGPSFRYDLHRTIDLGRWYAGGKTLYSELCTHKILWGKDPVFGALYPQDAVMEDELSCQGAICCFTSIPLRRTSRADEAICDSLIPDIVAVILHIVTVVWSQSIYLDWVTNRYHVGNKYILRKYLENNDYFKEEDFRKSILISVHKAKFD